MLHRIGLYLVPNIHQHRNRAGISTGKVEELHEFSYYSYGSRFCRWLGTTDWETILDTGCFKTSKQWSLKNGPYSSKKKTKIKNFNHQLSVDVKVKNG